MVGGRWLMGERRVKRSLTAAAKLVLVVELVVVLGDGNAELSTCSRLEKILRGRSSKKNKTSFVSHAKRGGKLSTTGARSCSGLGPYVTPQRGEESTSKSMSKKREAADYLAINLRIGSKRFCDSRLSPPVAALPCGNGP